jgi:hypothetical protein
LRNRSFLVVLLFAAGCASTTPTVDMNEPRRVVGTENAVRVDAQVYGDTLTTSSTVPVKYEITNQRETAIAFADLTPDVTYDPETQIVTVGLGSEVPGNEMVPRLIRIAPGQKKSFSTVARVQLRPNAAASMAPTARFPRALRLKVSFLGDTEPFRELIDIPERAVHDPGLADSLFTAWLERNETVYTNAVPMRWSFTAEPDPSAARGRRRRG